MVIKTRIRIDIQPKMLGPDPYQTRKDLLYEQWRGSGSRWIRKFGLIGSGIIFICCTGICPIKTRFGMIARSEAEKIIPDAKQCLKTAKV